MPSIMPPSLNMAMASARAEQGLLEALGMPRLTVGKHPYIESQAGAGGCVSYVPTRQMEKEREAMHSRSRAFVLQYGCLADHTWSRLAHQNVLFRAMAYCNFLL